jgi:internalin A
LLSDNSPILVIQNEKQGRKRAIDERGMKSRFNNLLKIMQTDLSSGKGLKEIIDELEHNIQKLSHIGTKLPSSWISIRLELEKLAIKKAYLSIEQYFEICEQFNVTTKSRCLYLSEYLHDIGVFLHYQNNPILKRWLFLNPVWATDAVYNVLDNDKVIQNNGCFSKTDLKEIWDDVKYEEMQDELLELMIRYELCYQLEDNNKYIAPQLLQVERPIYNEKYSRDEAIEIKYVYKFMPQGLMTQLIVRLHRFLKNQQLVWRSGAIFIWEDSEAEVIETYAENEIVIKVKGKNKKALFLLITESIERLSFKYSNIRFDKQIPCNCKTCCESKTQYLYNYDSLKTRLKRDKKTIECDISLENISILALLGDYYDGSGKSTQIDPLIPA